MARRISIGVATRGLGNINVVDDRVFTAGVGDVVQFGSNLQLNAQNDLRFADSDSSNWVAFQAPASIGSDVTWTLPAADGPSNFVLTTNGSGTLSWSEKGVQIQNNTTDSLTNYVMFTNTTSGEINTSRISTSNMTFQPSTGTLTVTSFVESSSADLKENFSPLINATEKILQLTPQIYDRKDGSSIEEPGLVAEEVYDIIPNIVSIDDNGKPKGIKYTKLTVYLIECIKYLNEEIKLLKRSNR